VRATAPHKPPPVGSLFTGPEDALARLEGGSRRRVRPRAAESCEASTGWRGVCRLGHCNRFPTTDTKGKR